MRKENILHLQLKYLVKYLNIIQIFKPIKLIV